MSKPARIKPLDADEKRELAELWLWASLEAHKQGQILISYMITGVDERAVLDELRKQRAKGKFTG